MKVLFVAQYGPLAASSRTRVFDYLPLLREAGVDCRVLVVAPDSLIRLNTQGLAKRLVYYLLTWLRTVWVGWICIFATGKYDAILLQKVLFSFPIPQLLKRYKSKILFDFDDAIFTLESPGESLLTRLRTRRRSRGLPAMLSASGHAIVENEYTAEFASRFCANVSQITGPIDTDRYSPHKKSERETIVLGWVGSPSTTRYLELIRDSLSEIGRKFPNVELCLIGADVFEIDHLPVTNLAWELETEVCHLGQFDIGLMPLPDDPFTKGKGGYKLLQYMAMGLPVVASPVEINCDIVSHEHTGFLAQSDDEWVAFLETLIKDKTLRTQMGIKGRARVVERYALKKSSTQLLTLLRHCAK